MDSMHVWDLLHPMRVDDYDMPAWDPGDPAPGPAAVMSGSFLSRVAHAATQPFRSIANVSIKAAEVPFQVAERVALTPFNLLSRGANALPGGGGGGGGGAPGPQIPDSSAPSDPSADQGDPDMSQGNWSHRKHHRHPAATSGFSLPDWHPLAALERLNPFSKPAGELLVSAVPGGVAAKEAHAIASKALKNGTLNPTHLKKAGALTRAARSGHKGSIAKIAGIKHAAGKGNPHAEVALDRLKLADTIQRGGTMQQSTTSLRHLRNVGLSTMKA